MNNTSKNPSTKPCKKPCKECPHIVSSIHNTNFLKIVDKMDSKGIVSNKEHGCHMVNPKNIFGTQTEKTKCVGK